MAKRPISPPLEDRASESPERWLTVHYLMQLVKRKCQYRGDVALSASVEVYLHAVHLAVSAIRYRICQLRQLLGFL